jgi:hypothetical protein
VEFPQHAGKIGLAMPQMAPYNSRGFGQRRHSEMLAVDHRLGFDQLPVEFRKRQFCGQHSMLDIE